MVNLYQKLILFGIILICSVHSIYDPNYEEPKKPQFTTGIAIPRKKTPEPQLQMHHNYSKVNQNQNTKINYQETPHHIQKIYPVFKNQPTTRNVPKTADTIKKPIINSRNQIEDENDRLINSLKATVKKKRNFKIEVYNKCPEGETGQFVYSVSCSQYLNCWKGRTSIQNCAPGTLFNPKTLSCDYPNKVECVTGPAQNTIRENIRNIRSQKQTPQQNCPVGFSGLIPNYNDCSMFINCNNGEENAQKCPPGTLFDTNKNVCNFPNMVTCFNGQNNRQNTHNQQTNYGGPQNAPCGTSQCQSVNGNQLGQGTNGRYGQHSQQNAQYGQSGQYNPQQPLTNTYSTNYQSVSNINDFYSQNQNRRHNDSLNYQQVYGFRPFNRTSGIYQTNYPSSSNINENRCQNQNCNTETSQGSVNAYGNTRQPNCYGQQCNNPTTGQQYHQNVNGQGQFNAQSQFSGQNQYSGQNQFSGQNRRTNQQPISCYGSNCNNLQPPSNINEPPPLNCQGQQCNTQQNVNRGQQPSCQGQHCNDNINGQQPLNCNGQRCTTSYNENINVQESSYDTTSYGGQSGYNQQNTNENSRCINGQCPNQQISSNNEQQMGCPYGQTCNTGQNVNAGYNQANINGDDCVNGQPCGNNRMIGYGRAYGESTNQRTCRGTNCINGQIINGNGNRKSSDRTDYNCPGPECPTRNTCIGQNCQLTSGVSQQKSNINGDSRTPRQNQEVKCPKNEPGIHPHPFKCDKFLNCANGMTFVQDCGPGTLFNPKIKVCDWPHNVDCKDGAKGGNGHGEEQNYGSDWNDHQNPDYGNTNPNTNYNYGRFTKSPQNYPDDLSYETTTEQLRNSPGSYNSYGQKLATPYQPNYPPTSSTYGGRSDGSRTPNPKGGQSPNWRPDTGSNTRPSYGNRRYSDFNQPESEAHTPIEDRRRPINNEKGSQSIPHFNPNSAYKPNDYDDTKDPESFQNPKVPLQITINSPYQNSQSTPRTRAIHDVDLTSKENNNNNIEDMDYYYEHIDIDNPDLEAENSNKFNENAADMDCYHENVFRCSQNKCISKELVCNGKKDCPDGKDEKECPKYLQQFELKKDSRLAVDEKIKWNNVSHTTCAYLCLEETSFMCKSFNYRKIDNTCFLTESNIPLSGKLMRYQPCDYYELKTAQIDCRKENLIQCANKKCIDQNQLCDGIDDCGDRMDEKNCKADDFGYKVELVGAEESNEGMIQVTAFNSTGFICDDLFGLRNAHVVCHELGFHLGAIEIKGNSYFAHKVNLKENNTFYMMDDVTCLGNETSLKDCDFNGWGVHDCMNGEIVGVVCQTEEKSCSEDGWRCKTGNDCVKLELVCDDYMDCKDGSDEDEKICQAPIELRLAKGAQPKEGRVEIKYHGVWGTICDDDFNDEAAKVVCHSLGFKGPASVKKEGYFGKGNGPIWLDQVYCFGNESNIEQCTHSNWGDSNCDHTEDVGVVCSNYEVFDFGRHFKHPKDKIPLLNTSISDPTYPITCGHRKNVTVDLEDDVEFRIVRGNKAKIGDYPWQAALRVKGQNTSAHLCGAVIISQNFVLTAAHCLDYSKGVYVIVAADYNVFENEGTEQQAFIEDYFIHENFKRGQNMSNDIALVKLKGQGFMLNENVQPLCLPEVDADYRNLNCTISGFGSIESGTSAFSRYLRAGWVPIQNSEICKMPHVYGSKFTEGMICAGSLDGGVDACDGDSGGPLACLNNGLFTLYGITSWGHRCGFANKPGVYVNVAFYRKWIDDKIKDNS